jgi:uridine kinase
VFEIEKIIPDDLPRKCETLLIGIDGYGGAGKSTLAKQLRENFPDAKIVRTDDFYFKDRFDLQRLKAQVLEPLSRNLAAVYQHFDWQTQMLGEWKKIKIGGIVIVEGVCSIHSELNEFYDFKIWIDCPREIRIERGIKRDGEAMRETWENIWMPAEDFYIENDLPRERADLVINGWK